MYFSYLFNKYSFDKLRHHHAFLFHVRRILFKEVEMTQDYSLNYLDYFRIFLFSLRIDLSDLREHLHIF